VLDEETTGFARLNIRLDELNFQWQYADPFNADWINIAGATSATFKPSDFLATGVNAGVPLRVQVTFIDGLGVKETVFSAPTGILLTNPLVNHAPFVVPQVSPPGLADTSARDGQPLGTTAHPGLYLPLITNFGDDITAANQLDFTATLKNGSALDTLGLHFEVLRDAAGLVTTGLITGTPTTGPGTIEVLVKATDGGGLSVTDDFIINVLPSANRAPAITSNGGGDAAAVTLPEGTTAVSTVTASDPNITDVLTFSIVGGPDADKFTIDATTGALAFAAPPNFEAPTDAGNDNIYDLIVQVSDGKLTDVQSIAVTVTNINEAPIIISNGAGDAAAIPVAENSTAVTTVRATDPDTAAGLTFSIAGGADAAKFSINPTTGALSFVTAPDFEVPTDAGANNVYDVTVRVSDGVLTDTQDIAVTVTNVGGLTLTGTAVPNTLTGGSEEDTITGLGGPDILSGLGGNDTITGGTGNDVINAGAGSDLIVYTIGDGADAVIGGTSNTDVDTLSIGGTLAADTLAVVFNGAVLTGVAGGTIAEIEKVIADLLGGSDTLSYGTGTTASVTVNLASSSASGFASIAGIENVTGGSGNDVLLGDTLDNILAGGAGNDTLVGGAGNDTLNGGTGTDMVSYAAETSAMFVNLATGSVARSLPGSVEDVLVSIENVTGGSGSDSITGNTGANLLDGGAGDDTLDGGNGNDTLIGGDGHDQLLGGIGADSLDGGTGNDVIVGGAGNDTLSGGAGNDAFSYTFGDGADVIDGGDGSDSLTILGTANSNVLSVTWTASGLTTFNGQSLTGIEHVTADLLGGGPDTLSYVGTTASVTVDLSLHAAFGFDSIAGIENVTGGSGNDTLIGDGAANVLTGGAGNDTYFVGAGDTVVEAAVAGTDTVNSSVSFTLGANVENLTLSGGANIIGTGNALANVILGNAGANTLSGGAGDDLLNGGAGQDSLNGGAGNDTLVGGSDTDTMTGGSGNDVFVFGPNFGNDIITDFDANPANGQDQLDLRALGITNFASQVQITTGQFDGSGGLDTHLAITASDGLHQIILLNVAGTGANIITLQDFIL